MHDLYTWLEEQSGGIRTYTEFHQKVRELARRDSDNAAILALLGRVAARFVARFEGEPFSVDDASAALVEFKALLNQAMAAMDGSTAEKFAFANKVATFDLLEAQAA